LSQDPLVSELVNKKKKENSSSSSFGVPVWQMMTSVELLYRLSTPPPSYHLLLPHFNDPSAWDSLFSKRKKWPRLPNE
jgi:hypothetical protein